MGLISLTFPYRTHFCVRHNLDLEAHEVREFEDYYTIPGVPLIEPAPYRVHRVRSQAVFLRAYVDFGGT